MGSSGNSEVRDEGGISKAEFAHLPARQGKRKFSFQVVVLPLSHLGFYCRELGSFQEVQKRAEVESSSLRDSESTASS